MIIMKSFREILEEKLKRTQTNQTNFSHFSSEKTNFFAQEINFNISDISFSEDKTTNFCLKKAGFSSYNIKPKVIIPKPHKLTCRQKNAITWFSRRGIDLPEHFTKADLIKAFRKMAFALHPDYNPSKETQNLYRELYECKEILIQVFKRN